MSADLPEQLTESFLRRIRKQFYPTNEKLFFQERNLLLQAITWPARYLDDRAVRLTAKRYKELLNLIIGTIVRKGNVAQIRSFGRYLLHAVQEHMKHHGDDYYNLGKNARALVDDVMLGLKPATKAPEPDRTVPALAEVHRVISASKPVRRKTTATALQTDLFADTTTSRDSRKLSQTFDTSGIPAPKLLKPARRDSDSRK